MTFDVLFFFPLWLWTMNIAAGNALISVLHTDIVLPLAPDYR